MVVCEFQQAALGGRVWLDAAVVQDVTDGKTARSECTGD
jgi:hypothetical protein